MARKDRKIGAGSLHHVYNRAIARRTMFESRRDRRTFMALVAREVRRGRLRVRAFCVLSTHYHLFVESVDGRLQRSMQCIQTSYSRYFNRTRRRDGPLVRGRYSSKLVDSIRYGDAVIRYIELNPIEAGLTQTTTDYEFSSAFRPRGRPRVWVDQADRPSDDASVTDSEMFADLADIMRMELERPEGTESVDELLEATPAGVLAWMRKKALLADGTAVGQPVCHWRDIERVVEVRMEDIRSLPPEPRMARRSIERGLRLGLIRQLAGLRLTAISDQAGVATASVRRALRVHANFLRTREDYAGLAAELGYAAIRSGVVWRVAGGGNVKSGG